MHAASKTTTAFLKATNTETISHGTPEDDMTAAAVEAPPLLTRHSPIPLELAEASANSQLRQYIAPSDKLNAPLGVLMRISRRYSHQDAPELLTHMTASQNAMSQHK